MHNNALLQADKQRQSARSSVPVWWDWVESVPSKQFAGCFLLILLRRLHDMHGKPAAGFPLVLLWSLLSIRLHKGYRRQPGRDTDEIQIRLNTLRGMQKKRFKLKRHWQPLCSLYTYLQTWLYSSVRLAPSTCYGCELPNNKP